MNISSIVIKVKQENYDELVKELQKNDVCDYHFGDKEQGKIIVTIDGEEVDDEIKKTSFLQNMKYVISAEMMQTYQEDLDVAIKELNEADPIPDILKNDDIKVGDIKYNGDLRKKDFYGGV